MNQTEARQMAHKVSEHTGRPWIATTLCANRGQHEQGPDANVWGVRIAEGSMTPMTDADEVHRTVFK